jgi:hypothetical protein
VVEGQESRHGSDSRPSVRGAIEAEWGNKYRSCQSDCSKFAGGDHSMGSAKLGDMSWVLLAAIGGDWRLR